MNYFTEQERAILDEVYRQFMKMMEVVPENRREGLYVYVHREKEGFFERACVNFSGSFFELENGKSKPHYFHPSISVNDVYKMCEVRGYRVERDSMGWLKAKIS